MDVNVDRSAASSIRFENVVKTYRGSSRPAVDSVSFSIEPGELVVLLGPSGCGKTTLLKLINRLIEPTSGTVYMDGADISASPPHLLRRRIGYVIQQTGLFPHMRVEENIAVVPKLLGWDSRRTSARVEELLDLVGLPPSQYRLRYPAHLSGGEQQRVGLARALAAGPSTLLMDEPFGALDAITRSRLQEELRLIHARLGQTIVFVTHDVEEAMRLATRMAVMEKGRIVQFDKPGCVVLSPASEFVADLVGTRDVLRRLSLTPVAQAAKPVSASPPVDAPRLPASADARSALSLLLESKSGVVVLHDSDGHSVGTVDIAAVHSLAVAHVPPSERTNGREK